MRWIYSFRETVPSSAGETKALLGGKGASLADMSKAGLRVPPGFTIVTEACRHFYQHGLQWPAELEGQLREYLGALERETARQFGRGPSPLFLSVRSGAARSMPGMMDTVLNCGIHPELAAQAGNAPGFWRDCVHFIESFAKCVGGLEFEREETNFEPSQELARELMRKFMSHTGRSFPTDPWDVLVHCVNGVFHSWQSERAVAYRKRHGIGDLPGTAVNIQAMFPSEISGIVFTQDPTNLAAEQIVIESAKGLGEAVVSGAVTPDRFLVSRHDRRLLKAFPGSGASAPIVADGETGVVIEAMTLSLAQIDDLCRLSLRIEEYFGAPMDIEWGWAGGEFALLQARVLRGLDAAKDVETARQEELLRLRSLAQDQRRIWVTHNLRETLRAPTPLTWEVVRRFMRGSGGFGLMYQDLGFTPSREVCEDGFLELIGGRIYADPERVAQLFWGGLPIRYDLQAIVKDQRELDRPPTKLAADGVDETLLFKLPGAVRSVIGSWRNMKRLRRTAKSTFEQQVLPPYLAYVATKREEDLARPTTSEVVQEVHDRCHRVLNEFARESLKPAFFGGISAGALETLLVQLMGETEGRRLTSTLTSALDTDSTFEQDVLLSRVARGDARLDDFLAQYGHRTAGEMELSEPRWREDPAALQQIIVQIGQTPGRSLTEIHDRKARDFAATRKILPTVLADCGGSSFLEDIESHLADARALLPYRELAKHYLMMGYELIRLAMLELARRWDIGDDIFFLHLEELEGFESNRSALRVAVEQRKIRWRSMQRLELPDVIDSEHLDGFGLPQEFDDAVEWQGHAISAGVASGTVRIVNNPREAGNLGGDYVLVCPSTDPGWTPLFINARALVVERGGMLSHGAIVARDFGIPAIVCPHATTLLRSGERLRVDGNLGVMTRIPHS